MASLIYGTVLGLLYKLLYNYSNFFYFKIIKLCVCMCDHVWYVSASAGAHEGQWHQMPRKL